MNAQKRTTAYKRFHNESECRNAKQNNKVYSLCWIQHLACLWRSTQPSSIHVFINVILVIQVKVHTI